MKEIFEAGRRFAAAEDALEDALLVHDPRFLKKMRMLRNAHVGHERDDWNALKARHGI
ncbi:MAG: hypothetical protein HY007_04355 [Candidatus Sungbacteria bacterium]|nr:hypothetical protein [Candidatus Sungbacteria bacterium]